MTQDLADNWIMDEKRSLLVAVDMPVEEEDLQPVVRLAADAGWVIDLLFAPPPEPDFVGYSETGGQGELEFRAEQMVRWESRLDELAAHLGTSGAEARTHLVTGPVVETILQCADQTDAALIAVVGHKHNVAHRVILGSVTGALIKASHRPVLVLPPGEPEPHPHLVTSAVDRLLEVIDRTDKETEQESPQELIDLRDAAAGFTEEPEANEATEATEGTEARRRTLIDALHRLETDHPGLTRAINDVAYYLSGLGI